MVVCECHFKFKLNQFYDIFFLHTVTSITSSIYTPVTDKLFKERSTKFRARWRIIGDTGTAFHSRSWEAMFGGIQLGLNLLQTLCNMNEGLMKVSEEYWKAAWLEQINNDMKVMGVLSFFVLDEICWILKALLARDWGHLSTKHHAGLGVIPLFWAQYIACCLAQALVGIRRDVKANYPTPQTPLRFPVMVIKISLDRPRYDLYCEICTTGISYCQCSFDHFGIANKCRVCCICALNLVFWNLHCPSKFLPSWVKLT